MQGGGGAFAAKPGSPRQAKLHVRREVIQRRLVKGGGILRVPAMLGPRELGNHADHLETRIKKRWSGNNVGGQAQHMRS